MKIGDVICYGAYGVCTVEDIRKEDVLGKKIEYYVLLPVFDTKTTFFVPTSGEQYTSRLMPLLNKEEINRLILSMPENLIEWIPDNRLRKESFKHTISDGTRMDVAALYYCLHMHKKSLSASGRSLHSSDMIFYKQVQMRLFSEISYVIGIDFEQVPDYIFSLIPEA